MATIKSFTSLEQSRKLAEFLPIESADMYYQYVLPKSDKIKHNPEIGNPVNALKWYNKGYTTSGKEPITLNKYCVPCWSLAALLSILPNYHVTNNGITGVVVWSLDTYSKEHDNPVDACYELILKLHKQNIF